MKISFITTIINEGETIERLLDSILNQTKQPDEIIIVDGGSRDNTVSKIKDLRLKNNDFNKKFIVLIKKGNRSVGRNEAIRHARGDIIICSDAGNTLDKEWIKNITEPFEDKHVDVVAGYYKGITKTVFQKCVIPYALVMPDRVDPGNFLPATRSIAFRKKIWERIGGFNEGLSHNEDYAFAKALQKAKAKIVFNKDAIVYWQPRNTFREAFMMMYRFAYGDAEARIFRPKVLFVFLRYFIGILLLFVAILMRSFSLVEFLVIFFILYLYWSIYKNYKYVNEWQAILILPTMQLIADWAVLKGTTLGMIGRKIGYN